MEKGADRRSGSVNRALHAALILLALGAGLPVEAGARAPVAPRTVEVEAEVHGSGRTPEQARREALERARELAVAEVAGIHVRAQQVRLKSEARDGLRDAFSYLVHTSSQGRIVREDVAFDTRVEGGIPIYRARLRADVVMETGHRDPGFDLEVRTVPDSGTLRDGEALKLVVTPSRDCYVTVLNLHEDGSVGRVFPNELEPDHHLPGGRASEIPAPDAPFEIRVTLGPGRADLQEQLLVVATADPVSFRPSDERSGELVPDGDASPGLTRLNQWLLQVPVDRRTEVLLAYEVVE
jgi:hypothetical protein